MRSVRGCLTLVLLLSALAFHTAAASAASLTDFDHVWVRAGYPAGASLELEWDGQDQWHWAAGLGGGGRSATLYLGGRQFRQASPQGAYVVAYIGLETGDSTRPVGALGIGWREPLDQLQIQGELGFVVQRRALIEAALSLGF